MEFILQMVGLFEIIFMNLFIFSKNTKRKYSLKFVICILFIYTIFLVVFGMLLIQSLGIYGNGNGLFTLLGFFYLLPLHYLYEESSIKHIFIICFCWVYTLSIFSISMQMGYLLINYNRFVVVVVCETILFMLTFHYMNQFINTIYTNLVDSKEEGIKKQLNHTSLAWFLTILAVNLLFVFKDNGILKILTIVIILGDVIFNFQLLLEVLKSKNRVGELQQQVSKDSLTQLGSRIALYIVLRKLVKEQANFYLIYLDLDNFKVINDQFGHTIGDDYLQAFAQQLLKVSKSELVFRIAGDEFIIIDKKKDINNLLKEIESIYFRLVNNNVMFHGVSYGYAEFPKHGLEIEQLINHADKMMYTMKSNKKQQR